jgi:TolA-binding protein
VIGTLLLFAVVAATQQRGLEAVVRDLDGERVCTVHARHERVEALALALASQSALTLQGAGVAVNTDPIDVDLVDRPLPQALGIILGAAGLRARIQGDVIVLESDDDPDADALDALAEAAYLRALRSFPDGEDTAGTEFAMGEIQSRRKNDEAACTHYDSVAKLRPDSPLAAEALWRAGSILQARGDWSEAAVRFSRLANLPRASSWTVKARLQLARSLAIAGDGTRALPMLDSLDRLFPANSNDERSLRLGVRATALCAAGRASEALTALDEALRLVPDLAAAPDMMRLRAEALERVGQTAAAGRAWLACAQAFEGAPKRVALENSARLALAASDFVGVLFLERESVGTGAEPAIAVLASRAREKLGFEAQHEPTNDSRIAQAEEFLALGSLSEAETLAEPMWQGRSALSAGQLARVSLVHARAIDAKSGIEPAIAVLRDAMSRLKDPALRKRIYLLAGELYERHENFDLAVEAYGGHL